MIKRSSVKLMLILISGALLCGGIALACADGWGEEYGVSNFTPEVFVDSTYSPFFYSQMFYYQIGHDESHNKRFNYDNVLEWSGYLNKGFIHDELEYLLLRANAAEIDSAEHYLSGQIKVLPDTMHSFILFKEINDKKVLAFLAYLQTAKKCEAFAVNDIPK